MPTLRFRDRLLATTIVAGTALIAAPAMAQTAPPPQDAQSTLPPQNSSSTPAAQAEPGQSTNPTIATPGTAPSTAVAPATDNTGEVVVTGSRITNPNLTSVTPITVVTAAEVRNQGNARVEDLVNSLPQVFANEGSTDSNGASGIATVDLRDLGPSRTLVLINGRRLGAGDPTDIASDLNFIPGALIKRVDVLTGGASATYGSDALAGVVNFILNTNFEGVQLDAQTSVYNHTNDYREANYLGANNARGYRLPQGMSTNGAIQNVTLTLGAGTGDGRGHVVGYAGWRKVNAVTQGDRDFSYCGYSAGTSSGSPYYTCGGSSTSAFGRFRRTVQTGTNPANGQPIYSATGSSYTANPAAPRGTPGGFGIYSGARDGFNFNPYNYFQRPDTRITAGVFANYDVSDAFKPYMEFMFMDDHTRAQIAPSGAFYGTDFAVNCNNPFLTSAQATQLCGANAGTATIQSVYIGRRNVEGGGRVDDLRHTDYRAVVGAKGEIAPGINYDVYGSFWKALLTETYFNDFSRIRLNRALNVVNVNGVATCQSVVDGTDPNCVPYNIFTGTTTVQATTAAGVTQAALNYLQTPGFQSGSNTEYVASGVISADLGRYGFQSPWASGGAQVVVGGEYRKEKIELNRDIEFLTGDLAGQGTPFGVPNVAGGYDVKEVFTEVSLPIVNNKPGFETLGLIGGYRYSKYSIQGSTHTYKAQIEYAPVKQLRFRAGYNRAVRAPNTLELFSAPTVGLFAGNDPCAGTSPSATAAQCALTGVTAAQYGNIDTNPANQYNQRTVGNINLKPEKSDTITAGVVVNPIRNLTLTADAFSIKVKGLISAPGPQFVINQCIAGNTSLCSFINRSSDGSLFTGPSFVANPTLNLGSEKTRGIDVTALYRVNTWGRQSISFDLVGTYLDRFDITPVPGGDKLSCAGAYGFNYCGTPLPKWRSKLRVTYQLTPELGITGAWRYFGKVTNDAIKIDGVSECPSSGAADPNGCINRAVAHIGSQSYFDLTLVARISDKYTFRIGAQNILDKAPPVLDSNYSNNGSNTYAQVYDSLGRYIYAAVQLNF
ncbi:MULTISPECIES: TonB-dependent receptor plug domain-containing protein [Sphingomonas]|uniref:TonB-dependent receptor plug domain-containing protein n=1 Tax=Sphingomonas TaxID=13687 RepID=UPI000DEFA973|nr:MULTISPECIES: TonB-dependent receptor [Sphingomonas]